MTIEELYPSYLGLTKYYLKANSIYLKNCMAFDKNTLDRQRDILVTVGINLNGVKTYIDSYPQSANLVTDEELNESINECVKLVKLFKNYYNEK